MRVFKPRDVYPCTTDLQSWDEDGSIRTLFGHLCSGTIFAHDREMAEIQDHRLPSKRRRKQTSLDPMTSSNGLCIEHLQDQKQNNPLISLERACSDLDDGSHYSHDLYPISNRPNLKYKAANSNSLIPTTLPSAPRLGDVRQSFEDCLVKNNTNATLLSRTVSDPTPVETSKLLEPQKMPHATVYQSRRRSPKIHVNLANQHRVDPEGIFPTSSNGRNERARGGRKVTSGGVTDSFRATRAPPIDSQSDKSSSVSDDAAGDCILIKTSGLDTPSSLFDGPAENESQTTLSDAAFESQSPGRRTAEINLQRVQHRKEAYKIARGLGAGCEIDHGLITSKAGHGEEELEL